MKKIFIVLGVLLLLGAIGVFYKTSAIANNVPCEERQGCCSWHGGVCGCTPSGATRCCDGTTSPSCRCW